MITSWILPGVALVVLGCGAVVETHATGTGAQHGAHDGGSSSSDGRPSGVGGSSGSASSAGGDGSGSGGVLGLGGLDERGPGPPSTGGASVDAGLGLGVELDAGTPMTRACEHRFAASYLAPCGGPTLPHVELRRIHALYMRVCTGLALPGIRTTAAKLEACAVDLEKRACQVQLGPPPSCDIRGTLPGSAPCNDDAQCASGACVKPDTCSPESCSPAPACGTCAQSATLGEDCHAAVCAPDQLCDTVTDAQTGGYRCIASTERALDEPCDNAGNRCRPELFCDRTTKRCSALRDLSEPCAEPLPTGCKPPLICAGTPAICQSPGVLGSACLVDAGCAVGLGCSRQQQCEPVTWVRPGGACDHGVLRCLIGECPSSMSRPEAVCPEVIADGQACSPFIGTCDTFSDCVNGVCVPHGGVACTGPGDQAGD
jgi:hypothetical protein